MNLNKTQKIIAIVVGLIIGVIGIFLGFRAVFTKAAGEEPQGVQVTAITQNSAKVSWTSAGEVQCSMEYGTTPTSLTFLSADVKETTNHSADLTLLSPNTSYYFDIKCGEKSYDNGGVPWNFSTKESQTTVKPTPTPAPPTVPPASPTPVASASPTATVTASAVTCSEAAKASPTMADCDAIKAKIGKGCDTQDYFRCRKKVTP